MTEGLADLARSALALSDEALWAQCDVSIYVGSGPGGQHRNKTESAVRLLHRPTGILVTASERRSQHQNRAAALERLRAKLAQAAHVDAPRHATRPTRSSKRRRLASKKHQGEKKASRRGSSFD